MQQQQEQRGMLDQAKTAMNVFVLVVRTFAVSVEVILHRRMGRHAIGTPALFAFFLIPLWGVFWPDENPQALWYLWMLFIGSCLINRLMPGRETHSRYTGRPMMMRFMANTDEAKVKALIEPVVLFVVGSLLMPLSQAVGSYLFCAALGLAFSVGVEFSLRQARAQQLTDARIEQEALAHEFHSLHQQ